MFTLYSALLISRKTKKEKIVPAFEDLMKSSRKMINFYNYSINKKGTTKEISLDWLEKFKEEGIREGFRKKRLLDFGF